MQNLEQQYQHYRELLAAVRQEHVLRFWSTLDVEQKQHLLSQLSRLHLDQLAGQAQLIKDQQKPHPININSLRPYPAIPLPQDEAEQQKHREAGQVGRELLRHGKVAVLVVAGGLGTRLGSEEPKGTLAIGPVSNRSLFQFHTEKVVSLGKRYGRPLHFMLMTSESNHSRTELYFQQHHYFGQDPAHISFFSQSSQPAFDEEGRILLGAPHMLALSPDGHGGLLRALQREQLIEQLLAEGVEYLYYFQVDNVLSNIADPVFLGFHVLYGSEMSSKSVAKRNADEKVGVFCLCDDKAVVKEYSEFPAELRSQLDSDGRLRFREGSIAIHVFSLAFLQRLQHTGVVLPYHVAHKKVTCIDADGRFVEPEKENGFKLEQFIFDALPYARQSMVMQTSREEEFSPVKNYDGVDSPATARQAMCDLFGRWVEMAGGMVPRDDKMHVTVNLEVRPLFSLDADEFNSKVPRGSHVSSDHLFE
jgi:UDP-N-acetylglucosamine/UDP-N-acetylgalactosamine diphosphorylase